MQKRANELAKIQTKPFVLQVEFGDILKRMRMPPALPGEDFQFDNEN